MIRTTEIEVRYAETDQMGVVHHATYPIWYEVGRTDFSIEMDIPYSKMEEMGIMMPVVELQSKYICSAHYGDKLKVETILKELTPVKAVFGYKVFKDNVLLNQGSTKHAWTDKNLKIINLKKKFPQIYEKMEKAKETE